MKRGLMAFLILVFVCMSTYADAEKVDLVKNFYEKAEAQQRAGKYKKCLETFSQMAKGVKKEKIESSDYYCKVVSLKAMCLAKSGNCDDAKKEIASIYDIELESFSGVNGSCSGLIPPWYFYPEILSSSGKHKEAIMYQDRYIEFLRSKDESQIRDIIYALKEKAKFLFKDKNYKEAIRIYDYLLSLKLAADDDLDSKIGKANCYRAMGVYGNALEILNGILADDYSNIENINKFYKYKFQQNFGIIRLSKASILMELGKSDELLKLSDEIMEKNITLAEYHSNFLKAQAYEQKKDYKNSLLFIEKAINVAPDEAKAQAQRYKQKIISMLN